MKKSKLIIGTLLILIAVSAYFIISGEESKSFDETRSEVVSDLDLAIAEAVSSGDYKCCIKPACTMCYLGNWLWEDGRCDCDGEIAKGNFDNVCPECNHGMETGECESSADIPEGTCLIN